MTTRQRIYAEYLLRKIGFKDETIINSYLEKLETIYGRYYEADEPLIYNNGYKSNYFPLKYTASDCIEELLSEINIKKHIWKIKLIQSNDAKYNSASDFSNFCFCPASYSISNSFLIEHPTQEDKRLLGLKLHETLRLINKKLPKNLTECDIVLTEVLENPNIEKIKNCKLVFCGHKENNEFFKNGKENFIGQPDYIFEDPKGKLFVVEEKFRYISTRFVDECSFEGKNILHIRKLAKTNFFPNHIIQLQSYIKFIEEYKIDYGILLYWFYDFNEDYPMIHSFNFKVITRVGNYDLLYNTKTELEHFKVQKVMDFNKNINPIKCAACVVNKYCVHKTGTFQKLTLPYERKDLKLKYIEFPGGL